MRDFELKGEILSLLRRIAKALDRIAATYPELPKKPKGEGLDS